MTTTSTSVSRQIRRGRIATGGEEIHVLAVAPVDVPHEGTIVLGHGAGGSGVVFFQQVEALSQAFQVVVWDQRGFGGSTASTGRMGPGAAAEDLLSVLDWVDDPRPVHLVGQSMSGWAVVRAAQLAPARVASLVLSASTGGMQNAATRASLDRFIAGVTAMAGQPVTAGSSAAISSSFAVREPALALLSQLVGMLPNPGVDAVRRIRASEVDVTEIAALAVRMLFIAGEHDWIFPPEELERLAAAIPTASITRVAGVGHSPYLEAPEEFNDILTRFVRGVDAGWPT